MRRCRWLSGARRSRPARCGTDCRRRSRANFPSSAPSPVRSGNDLCRCCRRRGRRTGQALLCPLHEPTPQEASFCMLGDQLAATT